MCTIIITFHWSFISTSAFEDNTSSKPPLSLSLPPTIDARRRNSFRGRGARGIHDVAPRRRVSTEERNLELCSPVNPPATTNACTCTKLTYCGLGHPSSLESLYMTAFQYIHRFSFQSWRKAKVVKWCRKK